MPRKKVTDVSGNGGLKRKRGGGKKKDREFSSDDEFDDFEQENTKKPGKPAAKAGLQPVTVADDVKEKIVRTRIASFCLHTVYTYTVTCTHLLFIFIHKHVKNCRVSNFLMTKSPKYDNLVKDPIKI